jgi:hypothetical protein
LVGEKLVIICHLNVLERKDHFVLEIPFVLLEVELLELANPFLLEGPFLKNPLLLEGHFF